MKSFKFNSINPIMLSQEQHVLSAMTLCGGHSTTTVSEAIAITFTVIPGEWKRKVDISYFKIMLLK